MPMPFLSCRLVGAMLQGMSYLSRLNAIQYLGLSYTPPPAKMPDFPWLNAVIADFLMLRRRDEQRASAD